MKYSKSLIAALLCFYSCKDNVTSPSQNTNNVIQPLSIGNTWIYYYQSYSALSANPVYSMNDTVIVVSDTLINGEKWFLIPNVGEKLERNEADGLYLYFYGKEFQFPEKIGDTLWLAQQHFRTILSISDSISINGITFINYKYEDIYNVTAQGYISRNIYWYAPNVGCTKYEMYLQFPPASEYLSGTGHLISYELH